MAKKRKKHHGGRASEELLQKWKDELIRKRGKPKTPKERRGSIIVDSPSKRKDVTPKRKRLHQKYQDSWTILPMHTSPVSYLVVSLYSYYDCSFRGGASFL